MRDRRVQLELAVASGSCSHIEENINRINSFSNNRSNTTRKGKLTIIALVPS